jgi:hypothetical protein
MRVPVLVLLLSIAAFPAKHPDRKARDNYAKQFVAEVEHDGWQRMAAWAMRPGCPFVCINHGNHDCLRLQWLNGGAVEAVDRFMTSEVKPRLPKLRELGFVEVDIFGLSPSHSYPNGMARFPIQ